MAAVNLVGCLAFSTFFLMISLAPALAWESGGDVAAGAVTTTFMVATTATQLMMPRLGKTWRPASLMSFSLVLLGPPSLGYLIQDSLPLALSVAMLRGVGFGIITVLTTTLVYVYAKDTARGAALGFYGLLSSLAGAFLPALGIFLLARSQISMAIAIATVLPLAGLFLLKPIKEASPAPLSRGKAMSHKLWISIGITGVFVPLLTFVPAAVAYGGQYTFLALSSSNPAVSLLFFGAAFALGRYFVGRLSDRFQPSYLILISSILAFLGVSAIAFHLAEPATLVSIIMAGLGVGGMATTSLIIVLRALDPGDVAVGSTLWNATFDTGIAIGGLGLGMVSSKYGYSSGFGLISVILSLSVVLALFLRRTVA